MFGWLLKEKRRPWGQPELAAAIETFTTRNIRHLERDIFSGLAAAELARQCVWMTILRMKTVDDRIAACLAGMIFSNYISTLLKADFDVASSYMARDILGDHFDAEGGEIFLMYVKLAAHEAPALTVFREPFGEWVLQPNMVNLLALSERFKFLHTTITGEPELPLD